MIDYVQLSFSVLFLTLIVLYVGWVRFRVLVIRQNLFAIRDRLWDDARELNCLDDSAYQEARSRINSTIRSAHRINLVVLLYSMVEFRGEDTRWLQSDNDELQSAIDRAIEQTVYCIIRYVIFFRPFSGWLVVHILGATVSIHKSVSRWFRSGGPSYFETAACP